MRPVRGTEAHQTDGLAELVCSNSFRSDDHETNAVGLLHDEMRRTGSIMMEMAARHAVPAGSALAVDRDAFSAAVTERLLAHPLITMERCEIAGLPPADWDSVVIATGPLTSPALAQAIRERTGETSLANQSLPQYAPFGTSARSKHNPSFEVSTIFRCCQVRLLRIWAWHFAG